MRAAALTILLLACGGAPPKTVATAATEPAPLPALAVPLLDGGTWSSDSARGTVLVIDVWASWCAPCRKGFPRLDALARQDGVSVVAISIDEEPEKARAFLAETPLAVPVAHDREQTVTRAPLAIARLPTVLVVDRAGQIRHRLEEPTEADYDALSGLVDALRAER